MEDKRKLKRNIDFDPARLDLILKARNIISMKQRADFLRACGCSYANYKAWKRRKSISETDLSAILYRLGVTADQLGVVNHKEAMNEYEDWICRFYASHHIIPNGRKDGEIIGNLIRCKVCKYYRDGDCWHEWDNDGWIYYQSVISEPNPDDYCSRAERKAKNDTGA